jgi:antitoxin FitA
MGQLVVRHLEDEVKSRLKRRAARNGRSMEEEARDILRNALKNERASSPHLGSRIVARFASHGLSTDLRELRGEPARPAHFK